MRCSLLAASVLAVAHAVDHQDGSSNSAIQKIIQMLNDMSAKAKKEKRDEEVEFAKFKTFCAGGKPALKKKIAKSKERIETLTAEIGVLGSEAETLGKNVAKLQNDVTNFEADKKESIKQREKDHAAFLEESKDYEESIDALDRAIIVLMKKSGDVPGAAMLQVASDSRLPVQARTVISEFLGMDSESDYEPPEAKAYESQSGGVIDMLKKLKDDFRDKLSQCEKEEMNSKNAHDMVVQDLTGSIDNAQKTAEEQTAEKEAKIEKRATNTKELESTKSVKEEDEKTYSNLDIECKEKTLSFDEKQQLRSDEIAALAKAIEILSGDSVSGNAEKHLSLRQASFAQLRSVTHTVADTVGKSDSKSEGIHRRLREFLAAESKRLHSKSLGLLAEQIAADPFSKVKKMIDDMITRLLKEANEDAEKEGWCDTEMGKSKMTRNKLSEEIDGLNSAIEDGQATIMKLTQEMADLSKDLDELEASVGEATDLRNAEKAKNKATIADASAAQKAIAAATAVLKDFYAKAAGATAFIQEKPSLLSKGIHMGSDEWKALANPNFKGTIDEGHQEGMQTFGEEYTGQQDAAGGVLALLEVAQSDFANLEADTKASETESQRSYESYTNEAKKNKAVKSRKIDMDESDKAAAESKLQDDIAELKATQDELIAANKYHDRLVPQCNDPGMTFEEAQAARQAEIQSLKEALEILDGQGA